MIYLINNLKYQAFFQQLLQCLSNLLLFLCQLWCSLYSCNHTKTHTLPFYWFLILIDLNRQDYSWMSALFLFLLLISFLKKKLFYDSLVLILKNSLLLWLLQAWYLYVFLLFLYLFEKCIIHQLEKIFFKIIFAFFLSSLFMSMYGFNQASWLSLMTLNTFSQN